MQLSAILGLATLIVSGVNAAPKFVGFDRTTAKPVPGAYFIELPAGCNPAVDIAAHLQSKGISNFKIRTQVQSKFMCGGSVQFDGTADVFADFAKALTVQKVVQRNRIAPASTASTTDPSNAEPIHTITGVNAARAAGFTGKGIKVAVIDTGVYYLHPALGGGFGPGYKVAYGYDLVGDGYNGYNDLVPDADPIDNCSADSHGTHCAGIIGSNALNLSNVNSTFVPPVPFSGVAIDVTIGAYRIFGCSADSTASDVIAAAIYKAAEDGSNVLSISVGGGPSYMDEVDSVAATRVGAAGHFVVAANGNDGSAGLFVPSSPGVAGGGLGVAAFDNVAVLKNPIIINGVKYPVGLGSNNANFVDNQILDIVVNNPAAESQNVLNDGCTAASINPAVKGKTAFIRWGSTSAGIGCGSRVRCSNAAAAGAIACLLYSDSVASDTTNIAGSPYIPSGFIQHAAGIAVLSSASTPVVQFKKAVENFPLATAGTVSSFSSPGLDSELYIKPDIGGIGGQVLSTISETAAADAGLPYAYAVYSGTSMATPYVAGCIALLLQSNPSLTFPQVRATLQNYAKPAPIFGSSLVDSVARQGAGLVQIYDSIISKTFVSPSALALNDTANTQQHYTLSITNNHNVAVTYTLSSFGAAQANGFILGDDAFQSQTGTIYTPSYATVTFNGDVKNATTVTIGAGKSSSVNVHFQTPVGADPTLYPIYSGYIKISNDLDEVPATVPYAGIVGSWKDAPIFVKSSPSFAQTTGLSSTGVYVNGADLLPAGYVYNATAADLGGDQLYPTVLAATTSRFASIDVIYTGSDAATVHQLSLLGLAHKPSQGIISYFSPLQRNSPGGAQSVQVASQYYFNGLVNPDATSPAVQLPAGQYQFRFSGLKHFGRVGADLRGSNYDIVYSENFNLVY
ncbi:hypothetical protein HDU76_000973 [Blyttiomyces sp. JEL0837]|nr:hypothetical protein HDU76_000973 [Blyttiomyces sp. JEL0837]